MKLDHHALQRYARQVILPELGPGGQERLHAATVLCVGAGGLGSPAALYLAAAGVGRLGVVEFDVVDVSNLHRQILHTTADVGRPKSQVAQERLRALNPDIQIDRYDVRLTAANALDLIRPYAVVIDGTDNLPTRYLVNDACVMLGKANVYGAVLRFEGQASLFAPHRNGPCYRCLFPEPPPPGATPNCAEAGVLGVVPGIIGTLQATEALKWILGVGQSLLGRLLLFDALHATFREVRVRRDPNCPVCGENPTITSLVDMEAGCSATASGGGGGAEDEVDVQEMRRALAEPPSDCEVLDVREPAEHEVGCLEGARRCPLSQVDRWATELDPSRSYLLCCRSGVRSLRAVELLRQQGFRHVKSVRGGLQAWVREIDPSFPLI